MEWPRRTAVLMLQGRGTDALVRGGQDTVGFALALVVLVLAATSATGCTVTGADDELARTACPAASVDVGVMLDAETCSYDFLIGGGERRRGGGGCDIDP